MTSKKVEPLFFPILFLHGKRGWINDLKDRITAEECVMWRLLMPEKYGSEYMTAMAVGPPFEISDIRTVRSEIPRLTQSHELCCQERWGGHHHYLYRAGVLFYSAQRDLSQGQTFS